VQCDTQHQRLYCWDAYDPQGRRRAKTVNGVTTYFIHDGPNELAELNSAGTRQRFYLNALGMDERVGLHDDAGGTGWQFFHANHQGSVVLTTLASTGGGAGTTTDYGAFGESMVTSGNPIGFTGRYLDAESGLYYYRARYYSPALGRFLQADPIGVADNINMYAYVGNDPMTGADPLGLFDEHAFREDATGDSSMMAIGRARIGGAYWIGSHAARDGQLLTGDVVNGMYPWQIGGRGARRIDPVTLLDGYKRGSGNPVILHACNTYASNTSRVIQQYTQSTVYAPDDYAWVGPRGNGIFEVYSAKKLDGNKPGTRSAFMAEGLGGRPFGDAITSIFVNTETGETTVNFTRSYTPVGSHISRTEKGSITCKDGKKCY
jgi:RHS repeat-associated protein